MEPGCYVVLFSGRWKQYQKYEGITIQMCPVLQSTYYLKFIHLGFLKMSNPDAQANLFLILHQHI